MKIQLPDLSEFKRSSNRKTVSHFTQLQGRHLASEVSPTEPSVGASCSQENKLHPAFLYEFLEDVTFFPLQLPVLRTELRRQMGEGVPPRAQPFSHSDLQPLPHYW